MLTVTEQAVWLEEIDNVERVAGMRTSVGHTEVEPLRVPIGVEVRLENELVLGWSAAVETIAP